MCDAAPAEKSRGRAQDQQEDEQQDHRFPERPQQQRDGDLFPDFRQEIALDDRLAEIERFRRQLVPNLARTLGDIVTGEPDPNTDCQNSKGEEQDQSAEISQLRSFIETRFHRLAPRRRD